MSILNRLRLSTHLDDAAIAAIWTDNVVDGRRPTHPHLRVCTTCRTRFSLFAEWLEDLRTDAAAEADEAFPPERLAAQHAQIFRRIEAAERPARVIAFPRVPAPAATRPSTASRWIAAAAAAGLIVGVGVGQMMDFRRPVASADPAGMQARLSVARPPAEKAAVAVTATAGDEDFLLDLDRSLSRPSVPELRAIDDLTPRAGEAPQ